MKPLQRQITANRRNARRSRGPKSPEGKSASSRNAITHGLLARDPVILGECYEDFDELQASLYADFQSAGESEEALVRTMATARWRMERVTRVETALFDSHIDDVLAQEKKHEDKPDDHEESPEEERDEKTRILGAAYAHSLRGNRDPLWRLARYEAMIQRTYSRALADLQRSRKLRAAQPASASPRTAVRAKAAGLAEISAPAVLERLRQAEPWLHGLCVALVQETGWEVPYETHGWNVRAVDSTLVKEPGRTGQQWRIHYSLKIPSLLCDHFELTPIKGAGTGERLERAPAGPGDLVLADRGYCKPPGIIELDRQGAAVIVRLNTSSLPLWAEQGGAFPLLGRVQTLAEPGATRGWPVWVQAGEHRVAGRLCVVRKSEQATQTTLRKIKWKSQHGGGPNKR